MSYDDHSHNVPPPPDITDADWQAMCERAHAAEAALEAWWRAEHGEELPAAEIVKIFEGQEIPDAP